MRGQSKPLISRRGFGRSAAGLAATALAAKAEQNDDAGLSAAETKEIDERYAEVIRKYGDRLSEEQRQRIRRVLTQNERMMSRVREYPVENGDTPATVLKLAGHK